MTIPVLRQLFQTSTSAQLKAIFEIFCEFKAANEHEVDIPGEMITCICGAFEMH